MVIDGNNINPAQPGKRNGGTDSAALDKRATRSDSDGAKRNEANSAVSARDTVELSAQVQNVGRLREALAQQPEVDEVRVEQLRQQIESGTYQVDANSIAAGILRSDNSL
ncbi:MAG: flagellar biosynthesis anti-sigma factor FlgM [Pseudomonadales bacterium]|nr:flagellar biosynthesis anti-sigma factor FlgM [Pseudomonadales bacterium]